LYAKLLRVNNPEKPSYGKWFYVCNAQAPDATCNYFTWNEQEEEEKKVVDEEENEEENAPQPTAKKIKATSTPTKNIEEEKPKPKKRRIESQSKKTVPKKKLFKSN